jgi:competence protein ComEA
MLRALRLTAALLAGLAVPALAQTTSTPAKPPPPPSGFTTSNRLPTTTTPATPVATATPAARPAAAPVAVAGKKIDVNSGSETELASLPGIGPVTAKNIVQGRPWDDLADLVKKKAMGQAVFDKNKDRFALANINTSSAADMAKTLPGIGDATAPKIVNGRPYASPDDLMTKKVLTAGQFAKIKDLVTY